MATLLENVQKYLRKRKIKKIRGNKKRILKLRELDEVKTVGIVFDASSEDLYKRSAHLVRHFASLRKEVKSISITNTDIIPAYADDTLSFNYILKKDINWYGLPNNKYVEDFINTEFDILINLDLKESSSLSFIVNTSMANLKIGINNNSEDIELDFMLEGIKDNDLSIFMKELLRYLEMIKTK